jgi:hypothetical protein
MGASIVAPGGFGRGRDVRNQGSRELGIEPHSFLKE